MRYNTYELGSVHIVGGRPIIQLVPNTEDKSGIWSLDYKTFRQIVDALDEFLVSIGHSVDINEGGNA